MKQDLRQKPMRPYNPWGAKPGEKPAEVAQRQVRQAHAQVRQQQQNATPKPTRGR